MTTISAILQNIAAENVASNSIPHQSIIPLPREKKMKKNTREKIESLVIKGTKNYPAYLKLIYTGESDFSSEDEAVTSERNLSKWQPVKSSAAAADQYDVNGDSKVIMADEETMDRYFGEIELGNDDGSTTVSPPHHTRYERHFVSRIKRNVAGMRKSKSEDNFYDSIEASSPDFGSTSDNQKKLLDPEETAKERKEMEAELAKLEEEIFTLRTVLNSRVDRANELKRKLNKSPMDGIKSDVTVRLQNLKQSEAVQRTGHVLKAFGNFASRKYEDVRKSVAMKSFGEAVSNVKLRVSGSKSEADFKQAMKEEATVAENDDSSVKKSEKDGEK
ncbi:hypothetical protein LSH36_163g03021 [Paralvinella palmiformis]|uniref:Tumor protein D52 n=1 Tax=Paralvinella palmiformis TaxID=53620 RepID=A0AAD9JSZ5_9ANNE|nr:hypothetical protein LSH36_163g03021 [Paralvinella palmiformis]